MKFKRENTDTVLDIPVPDSALQSSVAMQAWGIMRLGELGEGWSRVDPVTGGTTEVKYSSSTRRGYERLRDLDQYEQGIDGEYTKSVCEADDTYNKAIRKIDDDYNKSMRESNIFFGVAMIISVSLFVWGVLWMS